LPTAVAEESRPSKYPQFKSAFAEYRPLWFEARVKYRQVSMEDLANAMEQTMWGNLDTTKSNAPDGIEYFVSPDAYKRLERIAAEM
jgi:hypothetical protein